MFIPIGPDGGEQDVWTVDKDAQGKVTKKKLFGVRVSPSFPFWAVPLSKYPAGSPLWALAPCHTEVYEYAVQARTRTRGGNTSPWNDRLSLSFPPFQKPPSAFASHL
jgi:hypothetical protein